MSVSRFAASLLLASACCCGARAATMSATLSGGSLAIDSPCARGVEIVSDAGLRGQVVVQASADHQEELDHLKMDSAGAARIRTHPGECWSEDRDSQRRSSEPTLLLSVRVPAGFALAIDESGAGRYAVGAVGGRLSLNVSGAATLSDKAVTAVDIDLSGAGSVQLDRQEGDATIDVSGHGTVVVDQAAMGLLRVDMSGAGSLRIGAGRVGRADLRTSGAGNMQIGADVTDASVDISGLGDVQLGRVSGRLDKDVSGLGRVTVQR